MPVQHLSAATAAWAQEETGAGECLPKAEEHLGRRNLSCRTVTLTDATAIVELLGLAVPAAADVWAQELWRPQVEVVLPSLAALRAPVEAASARDSSTRMLRRQRPLPRRGASPTEGIAPSISLWAAVSAAVLVWHQALNSQAEQHHGVSYQISGPSAASESWAGGSKDNGR